MNKGIIALVVAIIVVGGGALAYNHNHKSNTTSSSNPYSSTDNMSNTSSNSSSKTPSSSTQSASTNAITIENFAFSPSSTTIKKGTKVTWTNKDSTTHTVTEIDSQTGPDSGNLSPGASYSFTFNTAGTFHYHCAIHSSMTGTVTVTE